MDTPHFIILIIVVAALLVFFALARFSGAVHRSPIEVVEILSAIRDGDVTGHLADDFIHIPIRDSALDAIRERFEQLVARFPTWEPQSPFPATSELQALIDRAHRLAHADPR